MLYRHKDGREIWADVHSRLIRAEDGEVEGVVATFRDIREQKQAQQALTWEAARLRAIVEAAPVGLGIVAADGEVLMRNDVLRKIWAGEAPVHSIDGFEAYKAFWPETGEQLIARGLAGGAGPEAPAVVRRHGGRHRAVRRHAGDDRALHRAHRRRRQRSWAP